jgi:hypothetical protein
MGRTEQSGLSSRKKIDFFIFIFTFFLRIQNIYILSKFQMVVGSPTRMVGMVAVPVPKTLKAVGIITSSKIISFCMNSNEVI